MNINLAEGWKLKQTKEGTAEDAKATAPPVSIGTPKVDEDESIVEDGFLRDMQYFIARTPEDKFYAIIPGMKDGKEHRGSKKSNKREAQEDAYKILNIIPPEGLLERGARRFPDSIK
jgi:hypothetical protein